MNNTQICNKIYQDVGNVKNLLDIGCGEGYLVNCLAKKLNSKIIGLDISNEGFNKAHRICERYNTCHLIECISGNAQSTMFEDNSFEAVTIVFSLHHIENPELALREMFRILKSDGKLVIVDYVVKKKKSKCRKYVIEQVNTLLNKTGFTSIKIEEPEEGCIYAVTKNFKRENQ